MGAVTFALPPDAEPDPADVAVALEVGDQLAVAFVQARLRESLAKYAAELEQRVEERTTQLVSANADLESYAYVVSHDLREPIRALLGFSVALAEDHGAQLPPDGRRYLERIHAAAERMDRLTQDLLDFSRLGRASLGLEPVALDGVVDEALAGVEVPAGARIDVDPGMPRVMGHRGTLVQMVRNLLQNAVKFVAPGSPPRVHVCAKAAGSMTRLVVADQGIGIAPADQARVFRPFERLHASESYSGTGIGLAIVARGAEKMGGAAGIESAPGHGSRFWIELRTADAGTAAAGTSRTSMTEREHG
jgi:signal transduction histidine kinase